MLRKELQKLAWSLLESLTKYKAAHAQENRKLIKDTVCCTMLGITGISIRVSEETSLNAQRIQVKTQREKGFFFLFIIKVL